MKTKIIAILLLFTVLPATGLTRTKTLDLVYSTRKPIVIKKKWGISELLIKNTSAEFIGLENTPQGEEVASYYSFKKIHRDDLLKRDFSLNLADIEPGHYTIHAMACYQMWEMNIEIR